MNRCECGGILKQIRQDLTIEVFCEKCGFKVAATDVYLFEEKYKKYNLYIVNGNYKNTEHIKIVSKTMNVNYLEARNLLKNYKKICVLSDTMGKLQTYVQNFKNKGIEYEIK